MGSNMANVTLLYTELNTTQHRDTAEIYTMKVLAAKEALCHTLGKLLLRVTNYMLLLYQKKRYRMEEMSGNNLQYVKLYRAIHFFILIQNSINNIKMSSI